MAPLPSVALFPMYIMLTRASEVPEPGKVPNCLGSTLASTAGLTSRSTSKSSANLERTGVSDIGLKWLFTSSTGVCLGTGAISASFQDLGSRASNYEQLRTSLTTWASKSAFSFKRHAGIASDCEALVGLRRVSFSRTLNSVTVGGLVCCTSPDASGCSGEKEFIPTNKSTYPCSTCFMNSKSQR